MSTDNCVSPAQSNYLQLAQQPDNKNTVYNDDWQQSKHHFGRWDSSVRFTLAAQRKY